MAEMTEIEWTGPDGRTVRRRHIKAASITVETRSGHVEKYSDVELMERPSHSGKLSRQWELGLKVTEMVHNLLRGGATVTVHGDSGETLVRLAVAITSMGHFHPGPDSQPPAEIPVTLTGGEL